MEKKQKKTELVNLILEDAVTKEQEEEETLHMLLSEKLSKNINSLSDQNLSFGSRMADNIARFAGSWTFIILFVSCLVAWIILNSVLLLSGGRAFDAYPFILLNLLLSCVAAIQAPVIMMSQNRQEEKDRLRAQNDYKVNLKSEIIIEDLHEKIDTLLANQARLLEKVAVLESQVKKQNG